MNKKIALAILFVCIHASFLAFTYDTNLLSGLAGFVDPLVVHRVLMLLQFLPLLVVINTKTLSTNRTLLFLTFAICISTVYAIGDFSLGFYGAAIDSQLGLFPRMRGPTALMAYADTGHLTFTDFHMDYFLEFVTVYFLSEVTGLNCIFTYVFIVKVFSIMIWSLLFVWSSTLVRGRGQQLWMLLLASSIILANQGYNDETSLGPVMLLLFYLVVRKHETRNLIPVVLLAVCGILFASFRETLLLGLISLITLLAIPWSKMGKNLQTKLSILRTPVSALILIFASVRVFILTSQEYFAGYAQLVFSIAKNFWAVLSGGWTLKQLPLTTFGRIHNPIDTSIALFATIFFVGLLSFLAVFSISLILRRSLDPFSLAICTVFILALAIPVSAYVTQKFSGYGSVYDFATATFFPRSMAPLAVLLMMSYFPKIKKRHFLTKKTIFIVATLFLSLTLIFAPFIFNRKEIKSSYDALTISGDTSEYVILGNNEYRFILSSVSNQSRIVVMSPPAGFIQHFLTLPLNYRTGAQISNAQTWLTVPSLANRVFDNRLFTTFVHGNSTLMDELPGFD